MNSEAVPGGGGGESSVGFDFPPILPHEATSVLLHSGPQADRGQWNWNKTRISHPKPGSSVGFNFSENL